MPAAVKFGKRDRPGHNGLRKISENIRSQLTWFDLLVGLGVSLLLSGLLVGFHYRSIPDYKAGDVASDEVRAPQDATYEDKTGTAAERAAVRERMPAVYDFDGVLIVHVEHDLSQAFSTARNILAERKAPPQGIPEPARRSALLSELGSSLGKEITPDILPFILQERFNASWTTRAGRSS
jgi:membrane-associated HD superfamily phosphohydrolase